MALIQKYEIAYISRMIHFKLKWSPFPLVKLYQIFLRNPYGQKNKSIFFKCHQMALISILFLTF